MAAVSQLAAPPTTWAPFEGPDTTITAMRKAALGERGVRSMPVRLLVENLVRELQPKDYLSEILAIRNFAHKHIRYLNDPLTVELVKDPQRFVEEIAAHGVGIGDCDDIATFIATLALAIGRTAEFVTVGFGERGAFSHVFTRIKEPKRGQWIVVDPVAGTDERRMLSRVTTWASHPVDV